MIRYVRASSAVTVLWLAVFACFPCQGQGGPPPAVSGQIKALVQALNSGNVHTWELMAEEHFTPGMLRRQTAAERQQVFESLRRDFGTISVGFVEGPDQPLRLHIQGSNGASGIIELTLENSPASKIDKIAVRFGGSGVPGEAAKVGPPPVTGVMPKEQLTVALDAYLQQLSSSDAFSGDVLIAKNGEILYTGSAGYADRANHISNTTSTRLNIGSVNKVFTKAAIEQLVAEQKLSLTDTIGKLLPDYPQGTSRSATIDQLLHHAGGIADVFGDDFSKRSKDGFRSNADYFKLVSGLKPLFSPGARTQYCNGCFVVLGAIIERISGVSYETYMAENIFKPAGMTATGFLQSDGVNSNTALGYTRTDGGAALQSNILLNGASGCAAGGGYSTTTDLFRYSEALQQHLIPDVASSNSLSVGGGAPGINAILKQEGSWTVVVLANLDPPAAETVSTNLVRALTKER